MKVENWRATIISRHLNKIAKHAKDLNEWELDFMHSIIENYTDKHGNASAEALAKKLTARQFNRLREIAEDL